MLSSIVTFADIDTLVADATRDAGLGQSAADQDTVRAGLVIGAVIGSVIFALYLLVLWFAWKGRNWARIVLWVLGGIGVLSGLLAPSSGNGLLSTIGVLDLLLTLAGIVLLALRPSNEWYRAEGRRRSAH